MNRPVRGVAIVVLAMFASLIANLSYSYLFRQSALTERPENRRVSDARFAQDRGPIMVGNSPIANSEAVKDRFKYQRSYASGKLYAPVTGYYTYEYGSSGLELSQNAVLSGNDDSQFINRLINTAAGSVPRGGTVETTLDAKAQKAAYQALSGRKGAVVALDYTTGAIKALVTTPSYDPNELATHDLTAARDAWKELNADTDRPMANRASREIYPPGSTFKLVTAAAALENGMKSTSTIDASAYQLPSSTRVISGSCGGTKITLAQAIKVSCNPGFARLGVELGADELAGQAEKFGFGSTFLDSELRSVASVFPDELDDAQTAMSAIGEYEVAATPLQMAVVAAAIANDGVVMEPYIVNRVLNADLSVVRTAETSQRSVAVSKSTAAQLQEMMLGVVESGTGTRAQISGLTIGGKTGTAHSDNERRPYAWFVSYAEELDLAVAVFVEDAEIPTSDIAGGRVAAPIAKAVFEAVK